MQAQKVTKHRSLSVQRLLDDITAQIRSGELQPGAFLPSAHDLAQQYGIGYVSVIRVYRMLSDAGLIETGRGRGAFVRGKAETRITELLVVLPSQEKISHLQNPHSDWVTKELLVGMNTATVSHGIRMQLLFADAVNQQWRDIIDGLQSNTGVLFTWFAPTHWVLRLQKRGIPYALAFPGEHGIWEEEIPCIYPDYFGGVRAVVASVCERQKTKAAFLGKPDCPHEGPRYRGYLAAIHEAGAEDVGVIPCPEITRAAGAQAMENYLATHSTIPFTLLVAGNDLRALGALDVFNKQGISVPGDVAVIGFDNIHQSEEVGLTTVCLPMREIGEVSIDWFLKQVVGSSPCAPPQYCYPCPILQRTSTQR